MAPVTYTLSNTAYVKLVLHCTKHPNSRVNGVLIGEKNNHEVLVTDIVPLLHHWTSLSPMMEIGLDLVSISNAFLPQARSHADERKLKIVGYYQADENPENERVLYPVGEKVGGLVRESFEFAFALVIDGKTIGSGEPSIIPFLPSTTSKITSWSRQAPIELSVPSSSSTQVSQFRLADERSPAVALNAVRELDLHAQFGDFDDHLEDVTIDWLRNSNVNYLITN